MPAVHDQCRGADLGGGIQVLLQELAARDPDPVVGRRHVEHIWSVHVEGDTGRFCGGLQAGSAPLVRDLWPFPGLWVTKEELGKGGLARLGFGYRVDLVTVAANCERVHSSGLRSVWVAKAEVSAFSSNSYRVTRSGGPVLAESPVPAVVTSEVSQPVPTKCGPRRLDTAVDAGERAGELQNQAKDKGNRADDDAGHGDVVLVAGLLRLPIGDDADDQPDKAAEKRQNQPDDAERPARISGFRRRRVGLVLGHGDS